MQGNDPALQRLIDQVLAARAVKGALDIRGGSTKAFYGGLAEGERQGEPLELRPLAGISSYEPTELVVTVRAGTPLAELEAALAEEGQCLPFEPPRLGAGSTVGGMVGAGLAGPARASVGGVRDYVHGATLLNGRGEVLSFGGQVMKNVAGYDVSRLMAGSMDVLGVVCEVSLKVLPLAPATATLAFDCSQTEALQRLGGWAGQPLPLNAGAWLQGRLLLRLAGAHAAVQAASAKLGGSLMAPDEAATLWSRLRDQQHEFFRGSADALAPGERLWRLSVPATAAPLALPGDTLIEWHGAQRWWLGKAAISEVRSVAEQAGGHATIYRTSNPADRTDRAESAEGAFTPLSAPLMRIHRGLKAAFDPDGLFNSGRLYADL